jgi:hypothetical protein
MSFLLSLVKYAFFAKKKIIDRHFAKRQGRSFCPLIIKKALSEKTMKTMKKTMKKLKNVFSQ